MRALVSWHGDFDLLVVSSDLLGIGDPNRASSVPIPASTGILPPYSICAIRGLGL